MFWHILAYLGCLILVLMVFLFKDVLDTTNSVQCGERLENTSKHNEILIYRARLGG
jgi:hypothetical protein